MVRQSAPPGDEGSMDEEMLDGAPEAEAGRIDLGEACDTR